MNNPFSNLFKSFLSKSTSSAIGIDIGSSSIKVVQLNRKGGKAVLETYGELSIGSYAGTDSGRATALPVEKLSEALKDLLKESSVTSTSAGLSISIGSSFIVFMKVPSSDEKVLRDMVPLEARKYIPVSISEVTLDWWVIPKSETATTEFQGGQRLQTDIGSDVLLVVIHNDALSKNKQIQSLTNLDVSFSEVEIFSTIRSSVEASITPQMIIDFGAASTKVFIVEKGILKASHVIAKGSQDITLSISASMNISFTEAERLKRSQGIIPNTSGANVSGISSLTIDYIFSEVERFILAFEKKYGKKISKIILTGGGALLKGIKEKGQTSLRVDVEIADPFSKLDYPGFLEDVLKEAGPEFSVAIGLAIRKLQES